MNCREVQRKLSAYMDCEMDGAASREIGAHLEACSECRRELETLSGVDALVRGALRYSPSADFSKELLAALPQRAGSSPSQLRKETRRGNCHGFHRAWKALRNFLEGYYDLLQARRVPSGSRSLDEFGDVPSSFIGHAYFRIMGTQPREVS